MKKKRPSIDGFIPRRPGDIIGGKSHGNNSDVVLGVSKNKPLHATGSNMTHRLGEQKEKSKVVRSDIDESLRDIDTSEGQVKKLSRRQKRRIKKMAKKPKSMLRRVFKWLIIALIAAVLALGGYAAYRFIVAGENIFQGSIFDILQSQALKQDSNGRSNFLILGTSEDDPGHPGARLTDSM